MEHVTIRKATEQDIDAIIALCKESLDEAYGAFIPLDKLLPWLEGEIIDRLVADEWPAMTVAEKNGVIAGVVTVTGNEVGLLWVGPAHRKSGIGGALMEHAEHAIAAEGFTEVCLNCFSDNGRAMDFYRIRGFDTVRSEMNEDASVMQDVMVKQLANPAGRQ